MEWLELTILGLVVGFFGVFVGSVVNLLVFRAKLSGAFGKLVDRDICVTPQVPADIIPFASFFAIKDRCMGSKRVVEWEYPAFELLCGVVFAALALRAVMGIGFPTFVETGEWALLFARDASIAVLLMIIFLYDLKYSVILDRFSIPAIIIAIVFNLALGADATNLLVAALTFGTFFGAQYLITNGQWVGNGDIRLGLLIGFLLGLEVGAVALLLSYIIASLYGILAIAVKHKTLTSHMPFGTFLAVGMLVATVAGRPLLDWYLGLLGV